VPVVLLALCRLVVILWAMSDAVQVYRDTEGHLIERLWKFVKHRAFCGRYQPTFAQFQAAIQEALDGLSTTHAEKLKSLMTLKFQRFEDVSLMAA